MSKSGVFAHFGSREELQISVIRGIPRVLLTRVPCRPSASPWLRVRALFTRWVDKVATEIRSGCIYISGAVNSTIVLARCVTPWSRWSTVGMAPTDRAIRLAVDVGDLRPDTDPMQMLFGTTVDPSCTTTHVFCVRRARWIGPTRRLSGSFSFML